MDDPTSENTPTKYYEPYKLTLLMKNKNTTNHMSFIRLDITSLCFHIEELTTHDLAFDIIGTSDC